MIFPKGFAISGKLVFTSYLLTALLLSLAVDVAHGQKQPKPGQPYALIFGSVWGPDDRPVYGVKVKIRRVQDKKAKWELLSDHQGEFAQRLPAGKADYVVWADLKDFKAADGTILHAGQDVTVHVAGDERVDIGLHLTR